MKKKLLALVLSLTVMAANCTAIIAGAESTDSAETSAKNTVIPDDALQWNGHYYKLYTLSGYRKGAAAYAAAEKACELLGGHLATITSENENAAVYKYIRSLNVKNAYFGFSDEDENGTWKWVTGETVSYTNWGSGEPNTETSAENYGMYFQDYPKGNWNDGDFGGITGGGAGAGGRNYICEWDYSATSLADIDQEVTTVKDKSLSTSQYQLLQAKIKKTTSSTLKLTWRKISSADGYIIYGNKCGTQNTFQPITTITSNTTTYYLAKGLKAGTYYKYFVVAYKNVGDEKMAVSISKTVHATTTGGRYGNAKSVKITKLGSSKKTLSKITLKVGKKATIKAKSVKKNKKIRTHRGLAYESSNPTVATVSKKGVIKAKSKGRCYIYVYAQNGVKKSIKVTVK